jgi:alanine-synthesizing transaminase
MLGIEPEDVYTGNGVSELIMMSMQAFLNPGDEVLIPTPDYPLWTAAVTLTGGKAVHYLCDEGADWLPDIGDIKRKITSRTKALAIINPNNPTGALYPDALLEEMLDLARQHNLLVLSDEIYDRLVMDGLEHTSAAALAPDLPMVTYNGLSKSHQICGFRCGWLTVSGDKRQTAGYREGLTVMASLRLCSNVLSQAVIKSALDDQACSDHLLAPGGRLYEQRECAYRMLGAIPGVSVVKPKAALYIFPKLDRQKFNLKDDKKLVLDFLKAKHVLITEGSAYNWSEPDHFRLTYLPQVDELSDVINRLEDFLRDYRQ